jgi:hypothetical protein
MVLLTAGVGMVEGSASFLVTATVPVVESEITLRSGDAEVQLLHIVNVGTTLLPSPSTVVACPRRSKVIVIG